MAGVRVQMWEGNTLKASFTTDEHGFYMWEYKYTGKPTTFTAKLPEVKGSNGKLMSVSFVFKANGFAIVNFHLPSPDGSIRSWIEVQAKWL